MADKKTSIRDDIQKALDDASDNPAPYGVAGGAILGALAGRALGRAAAGKKMQGMETDAQFKAFKNNSGRAAGALGAIVGAPNLGTPIALAIESDSARKKRLANLKRRK